MPMGTTRACGTSNPIGTVSKSCFGIRSFVPFGILCIVRTLGPVFSTRPPEAGILEELAVSFLKRCHILAAQRFSPTVTKSS